MATDGATHEEVFYNDGRERALHQYIFSHPDLDTSLRGNPPAIIQAIEEFAQSKFIMTFKQAKIDESRTLLASMDPPPTVLVELGTYIGNSALAWGDLLRSTNLGKADKVPQVFAVEPEAEFVEIARDFVDLAGLSDIVVVIKGFSGEFLRTLKSEHGVDKIDVLFMDHWEDAYLPDLRLVEELGFLHPGSLILADNTDVPGAPEYLEYVRSGQRTRSGFRYQTKTHDTQGKPDDPTTIEVSRVVEAS